MRRRSIWLLLWFTVCLPGLLVGQNLIPNGSFETYRNCPIRDNQLAEATPWYNPTRATPDFYHACYQTGQVPLAPHSGQGLARLYFDQGWAEYLAIRLTRPLEAGECYSFEMYVATETPTRYQTETLGAHFSAQPLTAPTSTDRLNTSPQVLDNLAHVEKLRWERLSGVINAKGGEQYVTIGSYFKSPPFLGFYYVYVDDVSLKRVTLDLGRDTTLCGRRSTLLLDGTTPDAIYYKWQDGSTQATLQVTRPGKYSVTAITSCKRLTDSITVDYSLDFDLGADSTLCNGQTLTLKVPVDSGSAYRWQDGSQQNSLTVGQAGQYSIRVTKASCIVSDTIQIRYVRPPTLELGPDQELCGAQTFTIRPTAADGQFFWQDAFTDTDRTVSTSGVYRAGVRNDCATVTDSITIDYGACDCQLYAPNSFTPNDDGQNDVFLAFGCGDITITSLSVFNRWGEVIFHTDTLPFQWNGYYHGELCPTGVYAWSVRYRLKQGKQIKLMQKQGPLSLIR
ncbi:gliding motility-associated C-terminal domain-containing protein [Spirosoma koreense]